MTQRRTYQCAHPYFVTFNVSDREWIFEDVKMTALLHRLILECGEMKGHLIYQFCIMPDHVHLLCHTALASRVGEPTLRGGFQISDIPPSLQCGLSSPRSKYQQPCPCGLKHDFNISDFIKSIRGTFAHKIGRHVWQPRFYDRIIDNEDQLHATIAYIQNNPITADLPDRYQKHPYQYYNRELVDGLFT